MREHERLIKRNEANDAHLMALLVAQRLFRDAVEIFRDQKDKPRGQKAMQKVDRQIRDAYSAWSKEMKKLYRRMWPPPKKKLHKTSFKGKKT